MQDCLATLMSKCTPTRALVDTIYVKYTQKNPNKFHLRCTFSQNLTPDSVTHLLSHFGTFSQHILSGSRLTDNTMRVLQFQLYKMDCEVTDTLHNRDLCSGIVLSNGQS